MKLKQFLTNLICVAVTAICILCFAACRETPKGDPDKLVELKIVHAPDKIDYVEGDIADPTGVIINAIYEDGHIVENVDYTLESTEPMTKTKYHMVFSYGGLKVRQSVRLTFKGNVPAYGVGNTSALENSVLEGKTLFFLGSSVTYGAQSGGVAMPEFIAKRNNCTAIKEALSGTTLANNDARVKGKSYIQRFENYLATDSAVKNVDVFVCQLSTNDMAYPETFGEVTAVEVKNLDEFDKATTFGAIEYITALAQKTWNCPVVFYTNSSMEGRDQAGTAPNYVKMIEGLNKAAEKWDIEIIDLYNDATFNEITEEQFSLYMADTVHPTMAGYREWWLPKFEQCLYSLFN